jgi:hypothetical protein
VFSLSILILRRSRRASSSGGRTYAPRNGGLCRCRTCAGDGGVPDPLCRP